MRSRERIDFGQTQPTWAISPHYQGRSHIVAEQGISVCNTEIGPSLSGRPDGPLICPECAIEWLKQTNPPVNTRRGELPPTPYQREGVL